MPARPCTMLSSDPPPASSGPPMIQNLPERGSEIQHGAEEGPGPRSDDSKEPPSCSSCGCEQPRYRCPRCDARSCSLECVKGTRWAGVWLVQLPGHACMPSGCGAPTPSKPHLPAAHKAETGCTGKRDRAAFIRRDQFDENSLLAGEQAAAQTLLVGLRELAARCVGMRAPQAGASSAAAAATSSQGCRAVRLGVRQATTPGRLTPRRRLSLPGGGKAAGGNGASRQAGWRRQAGPGRALPDIGASSQTVRPRVRMVV